MERKFLLTMTGESCAKSLQLCLTLCDPMDHKPPGSAVHGILQARNTGVGCHFLLQGNLPNLRIEPMYLMSPILACGFFTLVPAGKLWQMEWEAEAERGHKSS